MDYLRHSEIVTYLGDTFEDFGVFKLWAIRNISLHYRHILQHWMYKNPDELERFKKYITTKRNKNPYKFLLESYMKGMSRLHKLGRKPLAMDITIFYDFDNTITDIAKRDNFWDVHHQVCELVLGKDFLKSSMVEPYVKIGILSASGDKDGVHRFVNNMFPSCFNNIKIITTSGVDKKALMLRKLNFTQKRSILALVDDDMDMCKIASLNMVIPVWYNKGKVKRLTESM